VAAVTILGPVLRPAPALASWEPPSSARPYWPVPLSALWLARPRRHHGKLLAGRRSATWLKDGKRFYPQASERRLGTNPAACALLINQQPAAERELDDEHDCSVVLRERFTFRIGSSGTG
jgi:hypothetical protein